MKKIGQVVILALVLITLYILGPQIQVDTALISVPVPDDVEAYLQAEEAHFTDIRPNAEKIIIWADPATKHKTQLALIYIPGFGVSRPETAPLSDHVAATLEANLFYTRLTGHGRDNDAFAQATGNDWLNDAREAIAIGRKLGDQVVAIGSSTGATILLWLAAEGHLTKNDVLVLLSPNLGPNEAGIDLILGPWGPQIGRLALGEAIEWKAHNPQQALYWTTRYPTESIFQLLGLVELTREVDRAQIQSPTLIFYSPEDTVVDPSQTRAFYEQLSVTPKAMIAISDTQDPDKHVVAGDILSPQTTENVVSEIIAFLQKTTGN